MSERRLPRRVRVAIVARSFWLQASLNYEGMQNLGRLFALVPLARWLGLAGEPWGAFVRRHLSYFNSNPFIATLGLGALARIEADAAGAGGPGADVVERFSMRVSASLGAVGDALFWAAVRPHVVLTGVLAAAVLGPYGVAAAVMLWLAWVVSYRWLCFQWGWESGRRVAGVLSSTKLRRAAHIAGQAGAVASGAVFAVLLLVTALDADARLGAGSFVRLVSFVGSAITSATIVAMRQHAAWALLAAGGWVAAGATIAYIFGL